MHHLRRAYHLNDTHHAAILDDLGQLIADREFLSVGSGYRKIIGFLHAHGIPDAVRIEGTGFYGTELARVVADAGMRVVEVTRANRAERRLRRKSDARIDRIRTVMYQDMPAPTETPQLCEIE